MGPSTGKCFVYRYVVLINTFRVPHIDEVDFLSPVPSASLYAGTPKNKPHLRNLQSSSSYLQVRLLLLLCTFIFVFLMQVEFQYALVRYNIV